MRNTKRGSWFIQELNTALRLRSRDTHLADILVQVIRVQHLSCLVFHSFAKFCMLFALLFFLLALLFC